VLPAVVIIEAFIWLAGLYLLWRVVLGQGRTSAPALVRWPVSLESFVTAALMVAAGGWLLPQVPAYLSDEILGPAARDGDWWTLVQGAAFQLGLLSGALVGGVYLRHQLRRAPLMADSTPSLESAPPGLPTGHPLFAGTVTFLISIPLISGLGFAWKTLLEQFGFSTSEQEMVDLFRNADDPTFLVLMIILAAVIAPVTEELVFRAGLFRYLRTRVSRAFALTVPAMIFALLHGSATAFLPLFALGVFFALAYERTGRIAVPMIAHALFNLHTILLVMAGVTTD
jgi:membrane protease YdiL (CAAX protease family)